MRIPRHGSGISARHARSGWWRSAGACALGLALTLQSPGPAGAVSIELKDVASDRIERQRAATEGSLPLPGTPDLSRLNERLAEKGIKPGSPVLLRAFKSESEFEVWFRKDDGFVLFATYPVCNWSGTLGPKQREGDKQTPEGFYTVTRAQIHHIGRWPRSLNLGFPNEFDKAQARGGSNILVHGGCSSVGCFAMTNAVIEEIYAFVEQALASGQTFVPVHVYPFRMSAENLETQKASAWYPFWTNLKTVYDTFERTKLPPRIGVCEGRYVVQDAAPGEGADPGPLALCGATAAAIQAREQLPRAVRLQLSWLMNPPVAAPRSLSKDSPLHQNRPSPSTASAGRMGLTSNQSVDLGSARSQELLRAQAKQLTDLPPPCSIRRASCRRYVAVHEKSERRVAALHKRSRHASR
jgi:murein L,D-transpeptidase YafK